MRSPALEVADIFRDHGAAWRAANAGHVSLGQLKVMSAIEDCRTAALGGHVVRCENAACGYTAIAYNSCRNRHCPKCQGAAAREWLAEREGGLLPGPYFHVVFSLPAQIADIAYQNKAVIYDILFKASAEAMTTIAADPKHLGARIGFLSVLHTWGSALTTRVATARRNHSSAGQKRPLHDPERVSLSEAARICGVSHHTIQRLVEAGLLKREQITPRAPWEVSRRDLDAEPIRSVIERLHRTGKLVLQGGCAEDQLALFT